MRLPVILRPEAQVDVRGAYDDLERAHVGLGRQFALQLRGVFARIETMPELYGVVWQDVRAVRLKRFRHVVYYTVFPDRVEVLAVMHGSRNPGTWQSRL